MPPRLGAFFAIVLWGISFVATKAALREISPITLIFTRFALGTLLLLGMLLLRGEPPIPPRDSWWPLACMGFVGVFVHQLLQSYGLTMTSAVHTGWLIGLIPIWSAVLSAVVLRERFGPGKLSGLVLGFIGAVIVVTRGHFDSGLLALPATRGDLLILASTLNWAIYSVVGHGTLRRLGPSRATAGAMLLGWLMLAPLFFLHRGWSEYAQLTRVGWGATFFLGIGCSGLGYLFWYGALRRVEASRVAVFLYVEPLVTLAAAAILLREPVTVPAVVGGLLVMAGVLLVQTAGARRAARVAPAAGRADAS